jgi:hypothetical protein
MGTAGCTLTDRGLKTFTAWKALGGPGGRCGCVCGPRKQPTGALPIFVSTTIGCALRRLRLVSRHAVEYSGVALRDSAGDGSRNPVPL